MQVLRYHNKVWFGWHKKLLKKRKNIVSHNAKLLSFALSLTFFWEAMWINNTSYNFGGSVRSKNLFLRWWRTVNDTMMDGEIGLEKQKSKIRKYRVHYKLSSWAFNRMNVFVTNKHFMDWSLYLTWLRAMS